VTEPTLSERDRWLAHDLNHLAGIIADYADHVYERVLECETKGCWSEAVTQQVIHDSASLLSCTERVGRLTGRLLGAGCGDLGPEELDLNGLVRDLAPPGTPGSRSGIRFAYRLEPGLWPVVADRTAVEQVLMNLCRNAREAVGDRGAVSVATDNVLVDSGSDITGRGLGRGLAPGPYVCVTVTDTGPGMTADVLARIATPGFSTKNTCGGRNRGLGVAIAVRLLDWLGGELRLSSEPGRGTAARAYLPAGIRPGRPASADGDADGG
jgi:signal transduction histidine kinase